VDAAAWIGLVLALFAGAALTAGWMSSRHRASAESARRSFDELQSQLAASREQAGRLDALVGERTRRIEGLERDLFEKSSALDRLRDELATLNNQLTEVRTQRDAERTQAAEKLEVLNNARQELSLQFKALAQEILEDKSKRFAEQNRQSMGQLLDPLRERIIEFRSKVEEIHRLDTEQQAVLRTELGQLRNLNQEMSQQAHELATALRGQSKKQGNWGELILANVLERSGLQEGRDFRREVSFDTDEGKKRPDVIVYLPQNRHLVIDAKVSLNAYTRYVNADDEADRRQALREHVQAVSNRIRELSARDYFDLPGINSPEMVFMFIPVESAFVEALRADETLLEEAVGQNILVSTPTTLLTSLNIVRQLWRFEQQNRHSAELADRASKVYQKLQGFLASMQALGRQLDQARSSYEKAMGQLVSGRGNLITQAREFERLGVAVQSALPEELVSKAELEIDWEPSAEPASPDSGTA
jgi:DNA recombination protein RmuC